MPGYATEAEIRLFAESVLSSWFDISFTTARRRRITPSAALLALSLLRLSLAKTPHQRALGRPGAKAARDLGRILSKPARLRDWKGISHSLTSDVVLELHVLDVEFQLEPGDLPLPHL